jgi:ribosomal protein S18 acetylase RimI-like enzyme
MTRTIETPNKSDASAIADLFLADMTEQRVDVTREQLLSVAHHAVAEATRSAGRTVCWVCREGAGTDIVGVIFAHARQSLSFGGPSLWIEELYVVPSARGRGHGKALVGTLLTHAEQNGFLGVDIEAYQGNTPAAILYRTMGFHRMGRERFYYRFGQDEFL